MSRPREFSDELIFQGVDLALRKAGYSKLTLERIAQEINISPAALSKRFGSKQSLLYSYSDYVLQVIGHVFEEVQKQEEKHLDALKNIFLHSIGQVDTPQALANITSLYIEGLSDPGLKQRSRIRLQMIDEHVGKLLRQAVEAKELRNCDTEKVSRVLQSAVGGSLMIWIKEPERSLKEWINDCFEIVLGPLLNDVL